MRGLALALSESFVWQLISWHAKDQWHRGKFLIVGVLIYLVAASGVRLESFVFVALWYLVGVLLFAAINYASWVTFGRLVTTQKERNALSAKDRVTLSRSFWERPVRKANN